MKCPNCGHENRKEAKFCIKCAQSLLAEIVCSQCGHKNPQGSIFCEECAQPLEETPKSPPKKTKKPSTIEPTSFAYGRYQVKKFLGEGGKKKVYLVHDTVLDRDVAFALIKTAKLDDQTRKRITREAQAMGKLGDHPHIVSIHDMGEHQGQPYIVIPYMAGGDVEGLIETASEHRLPIEQTIAIGKCVCQGLEFAHSKGIVHRDLKPGNVWLSADGTAKIGDFGLAMASSSPEATRWAEKADLYAEPDTIERARADMLLGSIKVITGQPAEGVPILKRGLEIARRIGDSWTLTWAVLCYLSFVTAPQRNRERLELVEEQMERIRNWQGRRLPGNTRGPLPLIDVFIVNGQRHRVEQVIAEHREIAEHTGQANDQILTTYFDILLTVLDGHLEEALETGERVLERGEQLGIAGYSRGLAECVLIRPFIYLGKYDKALELAEGPAVRALCLAYANQNNEVSEILERDVITRPGIGTLKDEMGSWNDISYLEAGILINHRQAAELLLNRFSGAGLCISGFWHSTCIPRHMGGAAALLGRYDEARKYYQEAIKVCTDMPFRPELALTRLQLAELLLEHYPDEKSEALEHLDFAINEFREMKMQPSLERALRHKDILKA